MTNTCSILHEINIKYLDHIIRNTVSTAKFLTKGFLYLLVSQARQSEQTEGRQRQPPKCTVCKHPMKGHKNVATCPKNKKI